MKIVGRTGKHYLASIDEAEIAYLHGYDGLYSGYKDQLKKDNPKQDTANLEGLGIDVQGLFRKVERIRSREKEVVQAIQTMRGLADALEMSWPSLKITKE